MLKSSAWIKGIIPLPIMALLLCSGCSFVSPPPPPTPPTPPPAPENHKPVINYITAQQQVIPASSSRITCIATDADGDALIYAWSVNSGTITGTGDTVTWTAPEASGSYNITVTVTDGKGGESKDFATIAVTPKPNHAPIITLIVREKNEPPVTVTTTTAAIIVKRWSTTEIECKAEDPDGDTISFKWSATDGKVDGEGPIVQYIASAGGNFAVTVTAIDSKGASTKSSVYFHVPCCGQG